MKVRAIKNEAQYLGKYGDNEHLLPYKDWLKIDNWQIRNHYLTNVGKFLKLKVVSDIIGSDFDITNNQKVELELFWGKFPYPNSDNTKKNLAYFLKYNISDYVNTFNQLKRLTRGSKEWWITALGEKDGLVKFRNRIKTLNSAEVSPGKASKESLTVFDSVLPMLVEFDYKIGIEGNQEYCIYDYERKRRFFYDLCIPRLKLIFEFNGVFYHPNKEVLTEAEWARWTTARGGLTAEHQYDIDQRKITLAREKGYEIITLWSNNSKADNIKLCLDKIREKIDDPTF